MANRFLRTKAAVTAEGKSRLELIESVYQDCADNKDISYDRMSQMYAEEGVYISPSQISKYKRVKEILLLKHRIPKGLLENLTFEHAYELVLFCADDDTRDPYVILEWLDKKQKEEKRGVSVGEMKMYMLSLIMGSAGPIKTRPIKLTLGQFVGNLRESVIERANAILDDEPDDSALFAAGLDQLLKLDPMEFQEALGKWGRNAESPTEETPDD